METARQLSIDALILSTKAVRTNQTNNGVYKYQYSECY